MFNAPEGRAISMLGFGNKAPAGSSVEVNEIGVPWSRVTAGLIGFKVSSGV